MGIVCWLAIGANRYTISVSWIIYIFFFVHVCAACTVLQPERMVLVGSATFGEVIFTATAIAATAAAVAVCHTIPRKITIILIRMALARTRPSDHNIRNRINLFGQLQKESGRERERARESEKWYQLVSDGSVVDHTNTHTHNSVEMPWSL